MTIAGGGITSSGERTIKDSEPIFSTAPSVVGAPDDKNSGSQLWLEFKAPLRRCDMCGVRKTGWRTHYGSVETSDPEPSNPWRRVCPFCMSPRERALVVSIWEMNSQPIQIKKTRVGVEVSRN